MRTIPDYSVFKDETNLSPNDYGVIEVSTRRVLLTGLTKEQARIESRKFNKAREHRSIPKPISVVIYGIVALGLIGVFVLGCMAYFVKSIDHATDGLGRPLVQTPLIIQAIFGEDVLYPGFRWFILDMVIFWGSLAVIIWLVKFAEKLREKKSNDD